MRQSGKVISFGIFTVRLGKADDVLEFLDQSLQQARALDGLEDAWIAQSIDNPAQFLTYSKWASAADFDAMQAAYGISGLQESYSDIRQMLECDPMLGNYQVLE